MKPFLTKSIAILLLITAEKLNGQTLIPKYEAGINLGVFIYQGDLTPQKMGSFKTPTFCFNIYVSRILSPSFSLRTNLALGKLKGDESKYASPAYRRERNFYFKNQFSALLNDLG